MTESGMNETWQRAKELSDKSSDHLEQLRKCLAEIGHGNGKEWAKQESERYLIDHVADYQCDHVKWFLFEILESSDTYDTGLILDGYYEDHPLYQALVRDLPKEVIEMGVLYENGDALIEGFVSGAWEARDEREEKDCSDIGPPLA